MVRATEVNDTSLSAAEKPPENSDNRNSFTAFNHTAPCAVKRAGIVDVSTADYSTSGNQRLFWREPMRGAGLLPFGNETATAEC